MKEKMMTEGQFEVCMGKPALSGRIWACVYEEKPGYVYKPGYDPGDDESNVIKISQNWGVRVKWDLDGSLIPFICGYWCINLFMESIGPGPELQLPEKEIELKLDPCEHPDGKYHYDIKVRAGTVPVGCCATPYKLVVAVTYKDMCHCPRAMAGFVEGPMVTFYKDKDY
jgi:hypothetical protein